MPEKGHRRGFSRRVYPAGSVFRNGHGSESYDYSAVTADPRSPPLLDRFTRYEDVDKLLLQSDDRLVIMGPGDELTVWFQPSRTHSLSSKTATSCICRGDHGADFRCSCQCIPSAELQTLL